MILDHVEQPRAHEPPDEHLRRDCQHRVGIDALPAATDNRKPTTGDGGAQQHHAIATHRHTHAIVEGRQHPAEHPGHHRDRQPELTDRRLPTLPGSDPQYPGGRRRQPENREQPKPEQWQAAISPRDRRRQMKERRSHRPATPRAGSCRLSSSRVPPRRPATSATAGPAATGPSDSASTTAA